MLPQSVRPLHSVVMGHLAANPGRLRKTNAAASCHLVQIGRVGAVVTGITEELVQVGIPRGSKMPLGWHANVIVDRSKDLALLFCLVPIQSWLVDVLVAA